MPSAAHVSIKCSSASMRGSSTANRRHAPTRSGRARGPQTPRPRAEPVGFGVRRRDPRDRQACANAVVVPTVGIISGAGHGRNQSDRHIRDLEVERGRDNGVATFMNRDPAQVGPERHGNQQRRRSLVARLALDFRGQARAEIVVPRFPDLVRLGKLSQ